MDLGETASPPLELFRMAQENRWSPYEIGIERDRRRLLEMDEGRARDLVVQLRDEVDGFFTGDRKVAEDLTPLSLCFDEIEPQLYVSSQLLDEAVHTIWFQRYWDEVIKPAGEELGVDGTEELTDLDAIAGSPLYKVLTRTEAAMDRLLDDPSPESIASAIIHYHLTAEGLLGMVSLYRVGKIFEEDGDTGLPGWMAGFRYVRSDEARHVEFGTRMVRDLHEEEAVSGAHIEAEYEKLLPIIRNSFRSEVGEPHGLGYDGISVTEEELLSKVERNYTNILDRVTGRV